MTPVPVLAQSPPVQSLQFKAWISRENASFVHLVSLASPSHSFALIGSGFVHVLVLVDLHPELQADGSDQAVHPPCRTQLGFLAGSVHSGTQSSNISLFPGQGFPPFRGAGSVQ